MSEFVVASRYAKSLIDIAKENSLLEVVKSDMQLFLNACNSNNSLNLLLKSPIVNKDKKSQVLKAIFGSKVNQLSLSIFDITIKKGRENILDIVAQEFIKQYNKLNGLEEATIITSVALDSDTESKMVQLIEKVTSSKIILTKKIDPKLIGGFVVKVGDKQIDESVISKLNKIKLEFTKNPYQKSY